MKALYFDQQTEGKTIRAEPIPEDMHADAQKWRENLFEVLTQLRRQGPHHLGISRRQGDPAATLRAADPRADAGPADPAGPVRLGPRAHRHPAAHGRRHATICRARSIGRRWSARNPKKKDKEESRKPDPKEPFAAWSSRSSPTRTATSVLPAHLLRHAQGEQPGVRTRCRKAKEFASKIYHIHRRPDQPRGPADAYAGDIVGIIGPKDSITGDTLCDPQHPIVLEQIQFAEAVVSQSIEPESSADKDKLTTALDRLKREDPTFTWRLDPDTGQTLMSGMGMLHLEVKKHRLERDFRLKVKVRKPRVSYRETFTRAVKIEGECVRQAIGVGSGLFAKLTVDFTLDPTLAPNVIESDAPDGIPPLFEEAAREGVAGALSSGELGYPVIGVRARIHSHQMDQALSNDIAFAAAGADAVHKALKGNMQLLEPMMRA